MIPISSLIELYLSDSEKQQMIEDLIIPLCTDLLKEGVAKELAKMCGADAMVKYAELTKVESKVLIEGAIKVYLAIATHEALDKISLLANNDCFTEVEREEYQIQVSKLVALINQTSEEGVLGLVYAVVDSNTTPDYVTSLGTEMSDEASVNMVDSFFV